MYELQYNNTIYGNGRKYLSRITKTRKLKGKRLKEQKQLYN